MNLKMKHSFLLSVFTTKGLGHLVQWSECPHPIDKVVQAEDTGSNPVMSTTFSNLFEFFTTI